MAEPARRAGAGRLAVSVLAIAAILSLWTLAGRLPPGEWMQAIGRPDATNPAHMVVLHSLLPRIAVSILCGGALGLAGAMLQLVLRNPIASPTTLGMEAGAGLALSLALFRAPQLLALGREWIAAAGCLIAVAGVLALSWRARLAPLSVILAGLAIGLACSAFAAMLMLFETQYLTSLSVWGSGSLSQQGWGSVTALAPRLAAGLALALLLTRPLAILTMDDGQGRALGVSIHAVRLAALGIAIVLTASVVSRVGVIGFVGLAAPALAQAAGARRISRRLIWSTAIGAGLLWLTDQLVQILAGATGIMLSTGVVTALLGAPLLFWLLARFHVPGSAVPTPALAATASAQPRTIIAMLGFLLAAALVFSVSIGKGEEGWRILSGDDAALLMALRAPRVLAAMAAGAVLGLAGSMLQRLTGNPMASPELLGVSSGAAFGFAAMLFLLPVFGRSGQILGALAGALAVTLAMLLLVRRQSGSAAPILLIGIALAALFDAVVTAVMAAGDPRGLLLLNWMTGSTYGVGAPMALAATACLIGGASLVILLRRWLDIAPLGPTSSMSLGLRPRRSRAVILGACAALTSVATIVVGPLTFVGLMAPHLARRLGLRQTLSGFAASALLGALVMVAADWFGRNAAFPRQIPAGLSASMIGCPILFWALLRSSPR